MTAAQNSGPLRSVPSSCIGVIDCVGARVSAHVRGPATVVAVEGEVDLCNSDLLAAAIRRLSGSAGSVVLDMRATDFIGVSGFRELLAFAEECERARLGLHVVPGEALAPLLRVFTDHRLPVVDPDLPATDSA